MAAKLELQLVGINYDGMHHWSVTRNGKLLKGAGVCETDWYVFKAWNKDSVSQELHSLDEAIAFISNDIALRRKPFSLYYNGIAYTKAALCRLVGDKFKVEKLLGQAKRQYKLDHEKQSEWYLLDGILTVKFN